MGQLRIALRAYAAEGHPAAAVMARASVFLHDLDTERFATCIYADLDPATGRTQLVRAGHHGPLVPPLGTDAAGCSDESDMCRTASAGSRLMVSL